jgi:hypothetical protein
MSEISVVLRRRFLAKRWLRSWVFTPLGNVKIKLINKIERKRYRSVPDTELKRMVRDALTDRYPIRHFRDCSRLGTLSSGRTSMISDEYNLSVLELGLVFPKRKERLPDRSFRWGKASCHGAKPVKAITLAVATVQPQYQCDRRSSWRGDVNVPSVLRVLNPDSPPSSSKEDIEKSPLISISEIESIPDEPPVLVLTTPDSPQPQFSNEETQSEQPETILLPGIERPSRPVVADLNSAPRLPELDFIDRPDVPLCCSITQALRYCNSPILSERGICSCSTSVPDPHSTDLHSDLSHLLSTLATNNRELPDIFTEHSLNRRHRKRDAFLWQQPQLAKAASWPQPLKICKNGNSLRDKIRNGPLPSLPVSVHQRQDVDATSPTAQPYSLRYKVQHGSLPPLPHPNSHFTELSCFLSSSSCSSEAGPSHEPGTPSDLKSRDWTSSDLASPVYPPSSLCLSWVETQSEINVQSTHASIGSGSRQTTSLSLPHPMPPEEPTQHRHAIEDLPVSLRAGPQWARWPQETISQPPDDWASSPLVDHPPTPVVGSLWSAGSLENLLAAPVAGYDISVKPLLDVALCFGAGAAAKARRRREE